MTGQTLKRSSRSTRPCVDELHSPGRRRSTLLRPLSSSLRRKIETCGVSTCRRLLQRKPVDTCILLTEETRLTWLGSRFIQAVLADNLAEHSIFPKVGDVLVKRFEELIVLL